MPSRAKRFRPRFAKDRAQAERERKAALDRKRETADARGYDREWRTFRAGVLAEQPFCEACGSTDRLNVHHVLSVRTHPHLRLVRANVRVWCQSCHSSHTASEQGFARRV